MQAHQRLKITKEHTIKPKEEAEQENHASASNSVPKNLYCSVHRQVNKEHIYYIYCFIFKNLLLENFNFCLCILFPFSCSGKGDEP
jgi:hypothetical protein